MGLVHLTTGIDLGYDVDGTGDVVILLPGTGLPRSVWSRYQVPAIAQWASAVTLDPRGCGESTPFEGVYSMEQLAADVFALMDYLDIERAHIVGHSMGGRIALAMALLFPKRLQSIVLAASGSGPAAISGRDCVPGLPEQMARDLVERGLEGYVRHEVFDTTAYFTDAFRENKPEDVQEFWDSLWPGHARLHQYIGLCVARHTWESTHRLGDIAVPTLVLVGDQDTYGRNHVSQSEVLAQRIPNARLTVLRGQSHGLFWEKPDEPNAILKSWVTSHP